MDIRKHFDYNPDIDVSAAQIGISKWSWISIDEHEKENAADMMMKHRFDVLPVKSIDGNFKYYYTTKSWGDYSDVELKEVLLSDAIYYRTTLRDLIYRMHAERKRYYFLTDGSEVLGLVSLVNLNCQLVYNATYYRISAIERKISEVLRDTLDEGEILEYFTSSSDSFKQNVAKKYQKSIKNNADQDIYQFLYIHHLASLIEKFGDSIPDELDFLKNYIATFKQDGDLHHVRNAVSHSVQLLVDGSIESLTKLKSVYESIECLLKDFEQIDTFQNDPRLLI